MVNLNELMGLAKLSLTNEEREAVENAAQRINQSFSELKALDVSGAPPLVSVLTLTNVLREDVAAKMISREELLSNAPEQYDGYFQAPKTLE